MLEKSKIRAHGSQLRKINQKFGSHLQSAVYVKPFFSRTDFLVNQEDERKKNSIKGQIFE